MDNHEQVKNGLEVKITRLEERLVSAHDALRLQALEYSRRLDALNGEAERLREMQETYLPRESYEYAHRELNAKIEALSRLVYIGLGIVMCFEIFMKFFIK
jgi:hypothetical protein